MGNPNYTILGTFGNYEIRKRTDITYNFTEVVDTVAGRRVAHTYSVQKDIKKWARNRANARIGAVQKQIMKALSEMERLQKEQISWEDFKEKLDNPEPVDINKIYGN